MPKHTHEHRHACIYRYQTNKYKTKQKSSEWYDILQCTNTLSLTHTVHLHIHVTHTHTHKHTQIHTNTHTTTHTNTHTNTYTHITMNFLLATREVQIQCEFECEYDLLTAQGICAFRRESPWKLALAVVVQFEFSTKSCSVQNEFEKLDIFTVGAEYLYINNQNVRQCKEFTKRTFYMEV